MFKERNQKDCIKGPAHILYHAALIVLSASVALLLPYTADFITSRLIIFWTLIDNENISLVSVEIALAMVIILFSNYMILILLFNYFFSYIASSWKDRKVSSMAIGGDQGRISAKGFFAWKEIKRLKENREIAQDIS